MDLDDNDDSDDNDRDNDSDNDGDNIDIDIDFEEDFDKQIDQGNDYIAGNREDGADPQAEMALDNEEEAEEHEDECEEEENEGEDDQEWDQSERAQGNNHRRITMMDFFANRLQYRIGDSSEHLFHSRRLLQQLMVDMFCTMDMNRLNFLKQNQQTLRVELYSGN